MKLFSIVTINFNNKNGLEKTIQSVLLQNCKIFEFIVVDGNSTDGSVELLKKTIIIDKLIVEHDKGIYDAMNKGVKVATGKYLWFLNSGDCFYSESTLANCAKILDSNNSFDIYYGNVLVEYPGNYSRVKEAKEIENLWNKLSFSHQGVFCKTDILKKFKFDLNLKIIADQAFFYKCKLAGFSFFYVNQMLGIIEPGGYSEQKPLLVLQEKIKLLNDTNTKSISKSFIILRDFLIRIVIQSLKNTIPDKLTLLFTKLKYKN